MNSYVSVSCDELTDAQKKKFLKTLKVSFTASQVKSSSKKLALHPENAKKWKKAAQAGKGVSIVFSPGEIAASLNMDGDALTGSGMSGGSLWSWIKDKAWPWLQENVWPVVKPLVSGVVDQGAQALGAYTGQPGLVNAVRGEVKNLTGVGVCKKGSPEMKAKMAKLRSMRKTGGSFRLS
ncbi:uncharacterized protein PHALS_02375 [Plasmopara halstedii]|uniref:Uncharacterized protein n=1 Tax=Plasmopara halstedii TaxID=4781 RepID=A0A0P1AYU7_PLAHL|nr:uncharacterized protein PHALS_02375 [Plasmopara halstedii]CEG46052.1 hypothetical protein PHALS_02375 [Plasmopara halstedii]|eukprot:XP_024582421.1 hypothetical protein PHALS_02375 [Plasmopara halstedii]